MCACQEGLLKAYQGKAFLKIAWGICRRSGRRPGEGLEGPAGVRRIRGVPLVLLVIFSGPSSPSPGLPLGSLEIRHTSLRKAQEEPAAAQRSPRGAKRTQEEPEAARRSQEEPGGPRSSQELGRAREELGRSQEEPRMSPRAARSSQASPPGSTWLFLAPGWSHFLNNTDKELP